MTEKELEQLQWQKQIIREEMYETDRRDNKFFNAPVEKSKREQPYQKF